MQFVNTVDGLLNCVVELGTSDVLYVDLETTGLDPYTTDILLMSVRGNNKTFVIDFTRIPVLYLSAFKPLFESESIRKVLHNAVFDWKHIFHHSGTMMSPVYCTLIAEQVLKAGYMNSGFGLDDVAARRLNRVMNKAVRDAFIGRSIDTVFTQEELEYSAADVDALEPIYKQQQQEIERERLERVMNVECACIPYSSLMEYHGVAVNKDKLEAALPVVDAIVQRASTALQDEIIRLGGATSILFEGSSYLAVNPGSPKQMLEALNTIGIDVKSLGNKELSDWDHRWAMDNKDKIKDAAVSDDEDDELNIGFSHPILRKHAIRTAAGKIKGTYIEGLLQRINPVTGRIHPGFRQCGAVATGRMSSQAPNFQNIPNTRKLAALGLKEYDIRSMFVASPGYRLVICDYSGIELVILAAMSGDTNLMYQIGEGDIHSYVANSLFGEVLEKRFGSLITKENKDDKNLPFKTMRDEFKRVSYGICYGSGGWNLYRTCGATFAGYGIQLTPEICDGWVSDWKHRLFPMTGVLLNSNAEKAITQYYTESVLGRRRRWTVDVRMDKWKMLAAQREGMNQPIQATSADMTKLAITKLGPKIDHRNIKLLAAVHDELLVEASIDQVEQAKGLTKWAMETAGRELLPGVPPNLVKADPKDSDKYDK